jgi:carbon monoxide dehydrogenase subunit G
MTTYESSAKTIAKNSELVYSQLNNLKSLESFKEKIETSGQVKNLSITDNEISFDVDMAGRISFQVAESVPEKYVKYQLKSMLKDADLQVNIIKKDENVSEIKLSLAADLPLMIKMMLGSKLEDGMEKLADGLAAALNAAKV